MSDRGGAEAGAAGVCRGAAAAERRVVCVQNSRILYAAGANGEKMFSEIQILRGERQRC